MISSRKWKIRKNGAIEKDEIINSDILTILTSARPRKIGHRPITTKTMTTMFTIECLNETALEKIIEKISRGRVGVAVQANETTPPTAKRLSLLLIVQVGLKEGTKTESEKRLMSRIRFRVRYCLAAPDREFYRPQQAFRIQPRAVMPPLHLRRLSCRSEHGRRTPVLILTLRTAG